MSDPARRKGWCPGALRPMRSGDGLIVRVRARGGVLGAEAGRAIAAMAARHGNGAIDLTNRGNLQIRGVTEASLPLVQAGLAALGLLDIDAAAESRRNIVASPLAGLDPGLTLDVAAINAALDEALVAADDLGDLPAKFGFAVDGGGLLPLDGVEADIRISGDGAGRALIAAAGTPVAAVAEGQAVDAAMALTRLFLAVKHPDERRMHEVLARLGVDAMRRPLTRFGFAKPTSPHRGEVYPAPPSPLPGGERSAREASRVRGTFGGAPAPERSPLAPRRPVVRRDYLIAAAPFGRLGAMQLEALAALAGQAGGDLRVTPFRAMLVTGTTDPAPVKALGLLTRLDDPLLMVSACPGRPGCASGEAETQEDARRFAAVLPPGLTLHVSGCAKGCARRAPADVSLTASGGRYGLALRATADAPRETAPMTIDETLARLATLREPALA